MSNCTQCGKAGPIVQDAKVQSVIGMCKECAVKFAKQRQAEGEAQLKDVISKGASFLGKLFK